VPRADEQSLRPWLARLAASGRLVEIAGELDPAAGLAAQLIAHRSEPVRIARVRGSTLPVVANLLAGRSLIADALGVAEPELGRRLTRAIDAPLEPRVVADGPCQALAEEHPDLAQLPIPRWFEHEGGPYITAGCIVARDPRRASATGRSLACGRWAARGRSSASRPITISRWPRALRGNAAGVCRSP